MAGRTLHIRAGLIVGPHDYMDRFSYWIDRVSKGGTVLAPGRYNRPIQLIDVRDLAEWIIQLIERKKVGTFNAVGPDNPLSMGDFLEKANSVLNGNSTFKWVPEMQLKE